MNFLTNFITNVENHFEDITNIFIKFFKQVPIWTTTASTTLAFIAPVLETIVAIDGSVALDNKVVNVIKLIQSDLVLAAKFVNAVDSSKNLVDVLESIKTNVGDLLTIAAVKNSAHFAQYENYAKAIIGEIEAIISVLPKA
jgi:hypothetical protein